MWRPAGRRLCVAFSQDFRPFDFAQGRLWAIICRPSGTGFCRLQPDLSFFKNAGTDSMPPALRKSGEEWGTLGCGGAGEHRAATVLTVIPPTSRGGREKWSTLGVF